jgi:membrane dipeptidase
MVRQLQEFDVRRILYLTAALAMITTPAAAQDSPEAERVRAVLAATPLIDGHNDLPWQVAGRWNGDARRLDVTQDLSQLDPPMHTDIARLRAGGVGGQFWSVYVPASLEGPQAAVQVMRQVDLVRELVRRHPDVFAMAYTADDIERAHAEGRIASLIGMEGGNALDNSLGVLRSFQALGVRYITLTHSQNLDWADASTDEAAHDGLTPFGVAVVREMNRLGMLVDLSHVSEATMNDALDATRAPVIFSHSSAFALDDHPRNVPDAVLRRVAENGGVVMVTFVPGFISQEIRDWSRARTAENERLTAQWPNRGTADDAAVEAALAAWGAAHPLPVATLSQVADHIEHVRDVAGVDHVGLGGDFDGIETTVEGLNGVEDYPALLEELARRGWSDADLARLAGGNILRVMRRVEAVATELADEPANYATLQELDAATE